MKIHVAFDVSKHFTHAVSMCEDGRVLERAKLKTEPRALIEFVRLHGGGGAGGGEVEAVGLETGPLSVWLCHELSTAAWPVVCMPASGDAFHAHRSLSSKLN